jgi:membrane protein DedA with SNARE-associated domain
VSRQLFRFLISYKYAVIFPIATLEGPIITMISGFLVSLGVLSFFPTLLVVWAGDMLSDSLYYFLGRRGRPFVERLKFLRMSGERIAKIEQHYEKHPGKTFVISKVSYGVGSIFLVAAGIAKISYQKFLEYVAPLNLLRSAALMLIGYYLGKGVRYSGVYLEYYTIGVLVLLIGGYYIMRWTQKLQQETEK